MRVRLRHRKLPQSRMIDTVLPVPPEPTGHRRWLPFGDRSRTAFAWYSILRVAFPGGRVAYLQILAAYAAGVALNGFLPANLGTAVTLLMFVAIIPGANLPGVLGGMVVHKIFFSLAGVFVYLPDPRGAGVDRRQLGGRRRGAQRRDRRRDRDRLLTRPATREHRLERRVRGRAGHLGVRVDGRQASRRAVLHRGRGQSR